MTFSRWVYIVYYYFPSMSKAMILQNHIDFKKTSVKSKAKLQDIERYLKKFVNSKRKPLDQFTEEDIVKFLNSLTYSVRTINDIKIYLKVFIKWHFEDWSSRFRNLERLCRQQSPSKAYQPEQMLTIKEMEKLAKGEPDLMYRVYWLVLFYGGFRPSECARLRWDQIYFEPEGVIIKLHTSKTNKDFYKSLPEHVEALLKEWKEHNNSEFVFPSPVNDGDVIRARSICGKLKRLSKRVLGREIVPYQIRHSVGTILYGDDNRKDDDTANQMGHSKSMKHVYMNLDGEKIKAKARKLWIRDGLPEKKKHELEKRMDRAEQLIQRLLSTGKYENYKVVEDFLNERDGGNHWKTVKKVVEIPKT